MEAGGGRQSERCLVQLQSVVHALLTNVVGPRPAWPLPKPTWGALSGRLGEVGPLGQSWSKYG
eukprot:762092-Hanusia_phi.AAC.1